MSWSRRSLLCLPLLAAVAACGFTPVYGPGAQGRGLLNSIEVQEQTSREGFLLVRQLEERLGRAADPQYQLTLDITTSEAGLAVDPAGDIERFHVVGATSYALIETVTGETVLSGQVDDFTGYSSSGSTVATLASRRDAYERLMVILADELIVRLQTARLPS
ncbi:MAG: hypothetical protein HRU30_12595 [Rhodobacteraceae bacterium]|nr:hypothetical protein [Paracoccaceae bacterium]